jgi:nucleotide-binding universal stress UspA family protein
MTLPLTVPERVQTILVAYDGSEPSALAVPVAARLANRLGADIHLLSTVAKEEDEAGRAAELATLERDSALAGRVVACTVAVDLDPAGEIHEALRRLPDAVVCMGTHGRGRSAALIGSVASDVIARGHDPVVLVGPFVGDDPRHQASDYRGMLACVDETPASAAILPIAARWSHLLDEPLKVATVAEPVPPSARADAVEHRRFGPDGDVTAFLARVVEPLEDAGEHVEAIAVFDPISPADGIVLYTEENPAWMLTVSSHARQGISRLVFGSVAAAIVHRSRAPVLVVPRPDARPS